MKNKSLIINLLVLLLIGICLIVGFISNPTLFDKLLVAHESGSKESDSSKANEEFKRGPHRGRLLQEGDFQVEVTIFEPEGVPPRFRIYFFDNGTPVNPSEVTYKMMLKRINRTENIPFQQNGDYLESSIEASEPHSFKVNLSVEFKGKTYAWEYESYEGRVELTQEAVDANSIKVEQARPQILEIKLNVMGKIMPNEEFTVDISPRFPGLVKAVNKRLGDYVRKGEPLAVIESNESLQNYEIKSEINGMVIKKNVNIGMYLTGQENIFVVSDLQTVWADFNIYRHDLYQIKVEDPVEVKSLDGNLKEQSTISYISPVGHESTQSVSARAVLPNPNELWRPGFFISGEITVDKVTVSVAIKDAALQTFRDWDVVFISAGNMFEVVPVKLGRRNKEWVEIISGLSPGDAYVSENSFVLKADLEKSGAKHEH